MRKPTKRGLSILAILVIGAVVYFLARKYESQSPPMHQRQTAEQPAATNQLRRQLPPMSVSNETTKNAKSYAFADLTEEEKGRFMLGYKRGLEDNMSIRFYGLAVDQQGNGVSDAAVTILVGSFDESILTDLTKTGVKNTSIELKTDAQGSFSVENIKGSSLRIVRIEKEGYTADENEFMVFFYASRFSKVHKPDSAKPVLFHMWKNGPTERTLTGEANWQVLSDGRAYYFDFLKGKQSTDPSQGDLVVRISADPQPQRMPFDWSAVIEPVDGGIIETTDRFLYSAPESGYKPQFEVTMKASDPQWQREPKWKFYIHSRSGRLYAGVEFELHVNHRGEGLLILAYRVNPAGSRNLQ
jgi:hypothetical protein